jgi:hypothetical protein
MRRVTIGSIVLVASFAAAASPGARSSAGIEIGVQGLANANASIAASASFVGIAWAARTADGATDIYAATSRDAGRSFGAPVRVNQVSGPASVSGEQPPRIALVSAGARAPGLAVMWTAKAPSGTRLVTAHSNDGGRSFAAAVPVPGSDAEGNRGWESMAVSPKGDLVTLWLDHRDVPARPAGGAAMSGHEHGASTEHPSGDSMARAQLSQIFFARLNEPASAHSIASGVCYCCKTSVAVGRDGSIVASWRHVYPGNVRDIAFTKSTDGGRTFAAPVRVSEDNWKLDVCPENGPAVGVDAGNAIHVVWPTLVQGAAGTEPTMALFYATSTDGRRFTKRQQIPTEGVPRHSQIAVGTDGAITVVWDEQVNGARRVVVAERTLDDKGGVRFARKLIADGSGSYPVIAALPGATIVAWTAGSAGDSVLRVERFPGKEN